MKIIKELLNSVYGKKENHFITNEIKYEVRHTLTLSKKEIALLYSLVYQNTFGKAQDDIVIEKHIMEMINNEVNRVAFLNRKS